MNSFKHNYLFQEYSSHTELLALCFKVNRFFHNLDCNYTFAIDLPLFGAKLFGKMQLKLKFGLHFLCYDRVTKFSTIGIA